MVESRFFHFTRDGRFEAVATLDEALARTKKGGYMWLDYCEPSEEDLSHLIEPLGLHPLSIEDCLDEDQIPKIEDYPHHAFILMNVFTFFKKSLGVHEVDLLIGNNFLVTVAGRDEKGKPILEGIERYIERNLENSRGGPSFLLHVLLDHIVDEKFVTIEALEEELNDAEDTILADLPHFNPAELLRLRRYLLILRKSLFHEREILVKICRKDSPFISEKAILFYRDIYDHLAKFFELTEAYRDLVTSLMEIYLSMLNNQISKAAQNTNETMRRLTFITTIFMPLTLLAGIGGMSEWSMMTGPENWRIAYPVFLGGMVALGIANYLLLIRFERKRKVKEEEKALRQNI